MIGVEDHSYSVLASLSDEWAFVCGSRGRSPRDPSIATACSAVLNLLGASRAAMAFYPHSSGSPSHITVSQPAHDVP